MRYVYYNVIIILLATIAFALWHSTGANFGYRDGVVIINDRVISREEFADRERFADGYSRSRQEFIEDMVSRELLIQEARRRQIDEEESFRREIQDHYEQALIKQLIDRRSRELDIEVGSEDLANWRAATGYEMTLRLVRYADPRNANGGVPIGEEVLDTPFADLPPAIQLRVMDLAPGDRTAPFPLETGYGVIHLLNRDPVQKSLQTGLTDEELQSHLARAREQIAMEEWLLRMRSLADVTIDDSILQEGDAQ